MLQEINEEHLTDEKGNPAGGITTGTGIEIHWQNGPLGRGEDRVQANGAFVEGVIQAAIGRLDHYQASKFKCEENAETLDYLQLALGAMQRRTARRELAGTEGTHSK